MINEVLKAFSESLVSIKNTFMENLKSAKWPKCTQSSVYNIIYIKIVITAEL